jgi:hypothetical protein
MAKKMTCDNRQGLEMEFVDFPKLPPGGACSEPGMDNGAWKRLEDLPTASVVSSDGLIPVTFLPCFCFGGILDCALLRRHDSAAGQR